MTPFFRATHQLQDLQTLLPLWGSTAGLQCAAALDDAKRQAGRPQLLQQLEAPRTGKWWKMEKQIAKNEKKMLRDHLNTLRK